jgi:hypothetical protein
MIATAITSNRAANRALAILGYEYDAAEFVKATKADPTIVRIVAAWVSVVGKRAR